MENRWTEISIWAPIQDIITAECSEDSNLTSCWLFELIVSHILQQAVNRMTEPCCRPW